MHYTPYTPLDTVGILFIVSKDIEVANESSALPSCLLCTSMSTMEFMDHGSWIATIPSAVLKSGVAEYRKTYQAE